MFGHEMSGRKKRIAELAGMMKENKEGSKDKLQEIVAKFAIKVGVREEVANEYLDLLIKSKLVQFQYGTEFWKYNNEPEIEVFGTDI
jgi:predicted solute-binding protein